MDTAQLRNRNRKYFKHRRLEDIRRKKTELFVFLEDARVRTGYDCGAFEIVASVSYNSITTQAEAIAVAYDVTQVAGVAPVVPEDEEVQETTLKRGAMSYEDTDGTTRYITPPLDLITKRTTPADHENDLVMLGDHLVTKGQKEKSIAPINLFSMQPRSFLGRRKGFGGVEVLTPENLRVTLYRAGFQAAADYSQNVTQTLTDAAEITWNLSLGGVGIVTLGGNRDIDYTNATAGHRYCLIVKQDATGSRTLGFSTGFHFAGGSPPTVTATGSAVSVIWFVAETSSVLHCLGSSLDNKEEI